MTDAAKKLYPTNHTGPKKKPAKPKDSLLTHPAGGASKAPQQQKPAVKTTARPANAAKR